MRALILTLVLANLGFLAWIQWVLPQPAQGTRYDGGAIDLYSELDTDALIAAAAATAAAQISASGLDWSELSQLAGGDASLRDRCIAIGPFTDADNIAAAMNAMADVGLEARETVGEATIWDGYWIFVRAIPDLEIAGNMLDEINAAGIEDAYIIPESDSGILISLGVFVEESRAAAQLARVNALGYDATVTDQTRIGEAGWIELLVAEGEVDSFAGLRHPNSPGFIERRDCAIVGD